MDRAPVSEAGAGVGSNPAMGTKGKIVEKCGENTGWFIVQCCRGGYVDNGDSIDECPTCDGTAVLAWHEHSGVLALYPGGPLRGKANEIR